MGRDQDWVGQKRQHTRAVYNCTVSPFALCHVEADRRIAVFTQEPVHKRRVDHRQPPPARPRAGPGAHRCWKWLWSMPPPTRWPIFSNKLRNLFILKKLFRFPLSGGFRGGRGATLLSDTLLAFVLNSPARDIQRTPPGCNYCTKHLKNC